jgi:hypothetical protein
MSKSSQVRRLVHDSTGVTTVNMRASQVLVFWKSLTTIVPVEAGWYLHAASAPPASGADGERHSAFEEFDLKDPQVRWQHARINSIGRADLLLERDRRYVFYITQKEASREDLLDQHLPWPLRLRSPHSKEEPAVLAFMAWPLELDHHCDLHVLSGRDRVRDPSLVAFDSWEHDSIAEVPVHGRSVQAMVDMWAFRGLLEGGAMIYKLGYV